MINIFIISFIIIVFEKGVLSIFFSQDWFPQITLVYFLMLTHWIFKKRQDVKSPFVVVCFIFVLGLIYDLFSVSHLGITSFCFLVIFLVLFLFEKVFPSNTNLLSFPLKIIIGTVLFNLLILFFSILFQRSFNFSLIDIVIKLIISNLVVGVILSRFLTRLFQKEFAGSELEIH